MRYDVNKYKVYVYDQKNPDGTVKCKVVAAASTYAGKTVKGYAKCDPTDTFDRAKGIKLAAARCNKNVAEKRLKRAERKIAEASAALARAQKFMADMNRYHDDAVNDLVAANEEVAELESKM